MIKYLVYVCLALLACNDNNQETHTQTEGKETEMRALISKYPDSVILVESLIQYYRDKGEYNQAISEVDNAIMKDSGNPRLYDMKAVLHFENGDTTGAINAFERAILIYPSAKYFIPLGTLYAQTKNERALLIADQLLKQGEKVQKEGLYIIGLYHNFKGNKLEAISYFDKIIAANYTYMDAYREKAIALYDIGKYNESLAVLDKAVTLVNNFDEGYYYRGRTLEKLNRKDDAIESYKSALMYDPEYTEAKQALERLK